MLTLHPGSGVARALLIAALLALTIPALSGSETAGTALVRHAPTINGNATVDGSVQQMLPENVTFNGGATVTGDLLLPGTPMVRKNGRPSFGGTTDLDGSASPSNYQVTLNGRASLRYVVRRVDPFPLPTVSAPPLPQGTRSVHINSAGQSVGDWATLRDLTLNGEVGDYVVPPGRRQSAHDFGGVEHSLSEDPEVGRWCLKITGIPGSRHPQLRAPSGHKKSAPHAVHGRRGQSRE